MSPATEQILQAALALPDDERTKLIDALLETPADDAAPSLSPEWLAEIRRRSADRRGDGRADPRLGRDQKSSGAS